MKELVNRNDHHKEEEVEDEGSGETLRGDLLPPRNQYVSDEVLGGLEEASKIVSCEEKTVDRMEQNALQSNMTENETSTPQVIKSEEEMETEQGTIFHPSPGCIEQGLQLGAVASLSTPILDPSQEPAQLHTPSKSVIKQTTSSLKKLKPGIDEDFKVQAEREDAVPKMPAVGIIENDSKTEFIVKKSNNVGKVIQSPSIKVEEPSGAVTPELRKPTAARKESTTTKSSAKTKARATTLTTKPPTFSNLKRVLPIDLDPDTEMIAPKSTKKAKMEPVRTSRSTRSSVNPVSSLSEPIDVDLTDSEDENVVSVMLKTIEDATSTKFPRYSTGDVYIHIDQDHTYRLHSPILQRLSPFFKEAMKSNVKEFDDSIAKEMKKKQLKYRFDLTLSDKGVAYLKRSVSLCVTFMWYNSTNIVKTFTSLETSDKKDKDKFEELAYPLKYERIAVEAYDNLFRCHYHLPPSISKLNIGTAFKQCKMLLKIERYLQVHEVVRPHIITSLMDFGQDVYRAILHRPDVWLDLSLRLSCAPIFKEALTHIVGNYPAWQHKIVDIANRSERLHALIQRKISILDKMISDVEKKLIESSIVFGSLRPLFHDLQQGETNTWLVVMFWKGWHERNRAWHDKPLGYLDATMYRILSAGTYMQLNEVYERIEFTRGRGLTALELKEVVNDIQLMKEFATKAVQPLLINHSMLSPEQEGIQHFTCIDIRDDELPWNQPQVVN